MQLGASTVKNNTTLTEGLTTVVSDKCLRISDNRGTGNCMFHALSEQLDTVRGIKIQHGQLRQSLVQYLRKNPKLPDGTDLCHFVHGHETWANYLTEMEQDGARGDHLILCAAANYFKTCIHVVSSHNDVYIIHCIHCPVDESKPLVQEHIHEVHDVSLQPIQEGGLVPEVSTVSE
nr:OTU domain-containing protein DDB_G0284757-like [Pocillopora verrucosa]